MKSYSQFLNEAVEPPQKAWQDWLKSPAGVAAGSSKSSEEMSKAAKDFMKTFQRTGKAPDWATTSGGSSSTPPPPSKPPAQPPGGQQKPPAQPPGGQQKPPANWKSKAGTGVRRTFGAISAIDAATAAKEGRYGDAFTSGLLAAQGSRRLTRGVPELGRRAVQAGFTRAGASGAGKIAARFVPGLGTAYGIARGTQAAMRGDQLGAALGYGSALPVVGGAFAVADIARDVMPQEWKNKIAQTVGYRRTDTAAAQTKKDIEKLKARPRTSPSQVLSTMQTRSTRQVAAKAGTYGARQGSALTGIGGNTFTKKDTKGNAFMSTGTGSQRKTVQLPKTQLVKDPKTGQQRVGDLAFKGGKPVYLARPSVSSRDTSLVANIGRALNVGKYSKAAEQQAAKQEYRTALKNTQTYTKGLGISTQSATKQGLPGYGGAKPAAQPTSKPTPRLAPTVTPQQQATAQNIKSRMNAKRGGTRK